MRSRAPPLSWTHGCRPRAVRPRLGLLARPAGGHGDAGRGQGPADALGPPAGGGRGPPDRHVRQPALAAPGADPAPDLHGGVRDQGGGAGRLQADRRRPPGHQGRRPGHRAPLRRPRPGSPPVGARLPGRQLPGVRAPDRRPARRRRPPVPALRAYLEEVMGWGIRRMPDGARRVADLIGDPPRDVPQRPLWGLISFLAFQTLPDPLRRLYGVRGGPARQALLRASVLGLRVGRPLAPPRIRFVAPAGMAGWRLGGRYGPLVEAAAHWPGG